MPTSVPVQPTITEAGLAAIFNAQSTGVEFALTHIAFGTAQYVPDGTETALQAEKVRVTIAGGGRISPTQIQIYAIAQAVAGSPFFVGEVGFFGDDGTTLLAVYSSTATPNLFLSDTVSTSVSYALGLAALPASSVTVTIDPSASAALLIIGEHVAEADPHPQYVEKVNGVAFYDPTLAFNQGAQIIGDDLLVYQSAQANNIGNQPSTSPAWWVPLYNYGDTPVTGLTNASVTLSSTQAARAHITLSGALTAALNIIFPTWVKDWTVVNNTTGAFALTCKTAAGTGIVIPQNGSPTKIRGDGTNITQPAENVAVAVSSQNPVQLGQLTSVGINPGRLLRTSVYYNNAGTLFVSVNGGAFAAAGSSTFTPLAATTAVDVEAQGAGGGSGGTNTTAASQVSGSAGGGGGAYGRGYYTSGFSGVTITCGAAGAAGAAAGNGGNGGTSSFGSLLTAPGGNGSVAALVVAYTTFLLTTAAGGGAIATGGYINMKGFCSGAPIGTGGALLTGAGANSVLGSGAPPQSSGVGVAGTGFGSGASGPGTGASTSAVAGAAGSPGAIIVREYA